jgi:O-antigen/teichoic acid export membrane protein
MTQAPGIVPESDGTGTGPAPPLRAATAKGFVWSITQQVVIRFLSLVGFVVLARLLTPRDYGVVALATVFVSFLQIIAAAGMSQVLVQRREIDRADLDTVFWIGLGISAALTVLLAVAAWPLADAYGEPQLRGVLQVLSLTFISVGAGSTHLAVLQRRLAFKGIATATIIGNIVATIVGIAFAYAGLGVWSLVVQTLLGSYIATAGVIALSGYRPGSEVSGERFWGLFAASRHFVGTSFMYFLTGRTDDFLVGGVLGSAALGIYTIAYRLLTVMIDVLSASARSVAFPAFSRVQDEKERLSRAYSSATRMTAAISMPTFMFVCAAAPEIVHVLFGAKWAAAVPVMRILCLFGPVQAVMQFNGALLQSIGRARFVFWLQVGSTALQVVGFAIAVSHGIEWVAASFVIRAYLTAPVGLIAAAHSVDASLGEHLRGVVPPLISTAAMVAVVLAVHAALAGSLAPLPLLLALMFAGAGVYLGVLWLIGRRTFSEALVYARAALGRGGSTATAGLSG